MKNLLPVVCLLLTTNLLAQNVGIGTTTPNAKLEISSSTFFRPSLSLKDSASSFAGWLEMKQQSSARSMNIFGYAPTNAFSGSQRMDFGSDSANAIMTIKGNGNVGINRITPSEKLDVNGNINIANGSIKVNGAVGQPNQFLGTNSSGQFQWMNKDAFYNVAVFDNAVTDAWAVPPGVNKIMVEAWGGGGGGSSLTGGGGGGYLCSYLEIPSGVSYITLYVGPGGIGGITTGFVGSNTNVYIGSITLTANGGAPGSVGIINVGINKLVINSPGTGGGYSFPNALSNTIGIQGGAGSSKKIEMPLPHSTTSGLLDDETQYDGNGGNGGNTVNTGGKGINYVINSNGVRYSDNNTVLNGIAPGGGAGAGYNFLTTTAPNDNSNGGTGGRGRVIIHY